MAYARMNNKIALGSASTGLAATNFHDFWTTHSLFRLPVLDDEDIEQGCYMRVQLEEGMERADLLDACSLFVFDEFPSLHRECFEAINRFMNSFPTAVVVCMGDFKQIAPIVTSSKDDDPETSN